MVGITGIGSGMDINAIVKAMVEAEAAPKAAQLNRLEKATTTKLSALGQVQSALSKFQTALKDLNKMDLFEQRTAKSSDSSVLSASAEKDALPGTYSIAVQQLATSSKVATSSLDKDFTTTTTSSLTLSVGADDAEPVTVEIKEGASLVDIRDAINEQLKDKGISANLVNNPQDGTSQLVLSSSTTGEGKDIQLSASGELAALAISNQPGQESGQYLQLTQNACFTVDGLALESATNSVEGVIPDVTFTLNKASEDNKPLTLTVGQDNAGVKSKLQQFVDAYNEVIKVTAEVTAVAKVGEGQPVVGGLVGDSTVRNLLSGMRAELGNSSGLDNLKVMADLGITTQRDGTLKLDDAKLDKALEESYDQVAQFVAGDNGLMSRMNARIDGYTQTGGVLEQRVKGLQANHKTVDEQREALTRRVGQIEARLFKQFNAMDAMVAQLTQTSDRLAQSLSNLPGFVRKDTK